MVVGRWPVPYAPPVTRALKSVALELGAVVAYHCLRVTPTTKHFLLQQPDGRLARGPLHGECFDPAGEQVGDNKYVLVALSGGFIRTHVVYGDGLPGPIWAVGVKRGAWLDRSSLRRGADQAVLHVGTNIRSRSSASSGTLASSG
jgi:hypothetical protein